VDGNADGMGEDSIIHRKDETMARKVRRSVLSGNTAPRRLVTQTYAVDEFGELATRKRDALAQAVAHGHQMGSWHKRPNDPWGRQNNWCVDCNANLTVAVDLPPLMPGLVYGHALKVTCGEMKK
jgi:hypothetical protein